MSSENPTVASLQTKGQQWINDFVSFSHLIDGHQRECVTPYMHVLAYHVPEQVRVYGSIRRFSGQGVEKNNDIAKHHYYSGNRHDADRDILLTEARIDKIVEDNPEVVRKVRQYNQKKTIWWTEQIFEARKRQASPYDSDDDDEDESPESKREKCN